MRTQEVQAEALGDHRAAERSVRRDAGWLSIATLVVGAANFLYSLLLTWLLPEHAYTEYAGAQALLLVCGTAASASIPWVLTRHIAATPDGEDRRRLVRFALAMTATQGFVGGIVVGLLVAGFSHGATPWISGLAAIAIFSAATVVGYLQGEQRFAWIAVLRIVEVLLKVASALVLIRLGAGVAGGVAGFVVGSVAIIAVGGPPLLSRFRLAMDWFRDRELWRQTFGLAAIQGGVAVLANLDTVLGPLFGHGTPGLAGYQVSVILSRVPLFLSTAISTAVFVRMVADLRTRGAAMRSATTTLLSAAVPVTVTIATVPPAIAHLFLPHSYPATVLAYVHYTAAAGLLVALTNLVTTFFQGEGRFLRCSLLLVTGIVLEIIAIRLAMPVWGLLGLAAGAVFGQTLTFLLLGVRAVRTWGLSTLLPAPGAAVGLVALPLVALAHWPWVWLLYATAACALAAFIAFAGSPLTLLKRRAPAADGSGPDPEPPPTGLSRAFLLTSHPVAPPWNGADKNLARALLAARTGVDYTFVGDTLDPTSWPLRHRRRALSFRTGTPVAREKLRLFARLVVERSRFDLVHAIISFRASAITEVALLLLPLLRRTRVVITCPTGYHLPGRLLRRATAVVTVSATTRARLQGLGVRRVVQIPPGVDLNRFRAAPRAPAQAALGLPVGPVMLFAGHFDAGGGYDEVVNLFTQVASAATDLTLVTAMRVRPGHGRQAQRKRDQLAARGLAHRVVELGPATDMRMALQAASVVVYQPHSLGMKMDLPLTLLEALACGRPVVVSPQPTLVELDDGSGAVVVDDPAGDSAARHVLRLLHDPDYAARCGEAARALAERRYGAEAMTRAYADLYQELLREVAVPAVLREETEVGA